MAVGRASWRAAKTRRGRGVIRPTQISKCVDKIMHILEIEKLRPIHYNTNKIYSARNIRTSLCRWRVYEKCLRSANKQNTSLMRMKCIWTRSFEQCYTDRRWIVLWLPSRLRPYMFCFRVSVSMSPCPCRCPCLCVGVVRLEFINDVRIITG